MHKIVRWAFWLLLVFTVVFIGAVYVYQGKIAVISPQGMIGKKQSELMILSIYLMLIVVVPVFLMTAIIVWKYRSSRNHSDFDPRFTHSTKAEIVWWGVPFIIILILSALTWKGAHELDPFKPIESDIQPLRVQVVALQWKWLFIYPEQKIATVNFLQFPEKTPIHFEITSDAPMNSFWIPELGGQIYAMSGMRSQLYLVADAPGNYRGLSAHISGDGFSGMYFVAKASSDAEFDEWVQAVQASSGVLNRTSYESLAKPSAYDPESFYRLADPGLFDWVIMKYMMPMSDKIKEGA